MSLRWFSVILFGMLTACSSQPSNSTAQPLTVPLFNEVFELQAGTERLEIQNLLGKTRLVASADSSVHIRATLHIFDPVAHVPETLRLNTRVTAKPDGRGMLVWVDYPPQLAGQLFYPYEKDAFRSVLGSGSLYQTEYRGLQFKLKTGGRQRLVHLQVDLEIALPAGLETQLLQNYGQVEVMQLANNPVSVKGEQLWLTSLQHKGVFQSETKGGDVHLTGFQGEAIVHNRRGGVIIKESRLHAQVESRSGSILLERNQGVLDVLTLSGDVELRHTQGKAVVQTGAGSVHSAVGAELEQLQITTAQGNIEIQGSVSETFQLKLQSERGNILLAVNGIEQCRINTQSRLPLESRLVFASSGIQRLQYLPDGGRCQAELQSTWGQLVIR